MLSARRSGFVAFLLCALGSSLAEAQQPPPPPPQQQYPQQPADNGGGARSSTQFTLKREAVGGVDAANARARARTGDCAGALPLFDAALRSGGVDPQLRRDRGLCHEKLGNPFPAIEDFRFYITERPDAPDADQIRQHIAALEGATGTGSTKHETDPEGGHGERRLSGDVGASAKGGWGGSRGDGSAEGGSSSSNVIGPKPGEKARDYDYYVQQEKLADSADKSPLRYGTGFVLGPFVQMPRFFLGDGAAPGRLAYAVGGAFRYVASSTVSVITELGYAGIGTSGENTSQSGPLLMGGVELRFPVSRWAADHLLLRGGVGYERYVFSGTRAVSNDLLGRFAFGYRHVFGPSIGLEFLADGGPVMVFPENGDTRINGVIGLSIAFVVGF
jgi:hypothetical protein